MRIMLCIPTFLLDQDDRNVSPDQILVRQRHLASFRVLARELEDDDHEVYCALKLYTWRKSKFFPAKEAVRRDWNEVQEAHHVIACPMVGGDSSQGVHVEVGWATALAKPLTLLLQRPRTRHTVLITGLRAQTGFKVRNVYYQDDPSEVCPMLVKQLRGESI